MLEGFDAAFLGVFDSPGDLLAQTWKSLLDASRGNGDRGRPECCSRFDDPVGIRFSETVPLFPVGGGGVGGRDGLSDTGWPIADADMPVTADGGGELLEAAVLLGDEK